MRVFSLRRNVASLFERRAGNYEWIDGLRAIAILWVLAYHTLVYAGDPIRHGPLEPWFRIPNRGLLGVDVFFVLSGFLIGSILLRELHENDGQLDIRRFYIRRALRILPAYWLALAIFCAVDGKNASTVWANLLFVNNLLPEDEQCMGWSWSLAVEEQFYFVLPLVLVTTFRRALVPVVLGGLGLAAIIMRGVLVVQHHLYERTVDHARVYISTLYDKPHTRFPELLAGVIVAWLVLFTDLPRHLREKPARAVAGTFGALVVIGLLATARQPFFLYELPPIANFLYYVLSAPLFGAAVAYLMFACFASAGGGSRLARLLAWRPLHPIAQLSYSTYLVHVLVIRFAVGARVLEPARTIPTMCLYLVIVPLLCLASAVPLYLCIERPFMSLRK